MPHTRCASGVQSKRSAIRSRSSLQVSVARKTQRHQMRQLPHLDKNLQDEESSGALRRVPSRPARKRLHDEEARLRGLSHRQEIKIYHGRIRPQPNEIQTSFQTCSPNLQELPHENTKNGSGNELYELPSRGISALCEGGRPFQRSGLFAVSHRSYLQENHVQPQPANRVPPRRKARQAILQGMSSSQSQAASKNGARDVRAL